MTIKEFVKKVIFPIGAVLLLFVVLCPLCTENGVCDWRKLLLFAGIPFGIQKMFFLIAPRGLDIGGTIGMVIFNLLIGGFIGSVILVWRFVLVAIYLVIGCGAALRWIFGKICRQIV